MAEIQFSRGVTEETVPEVRLTRSRDGKRGTATFYFDNPKILSPDSTDEVTGMYMVDEEGEIITRDVKAKFINGRGDSVEVVHRMENQNEWERFLRFMNRYAEKNGLGLTKSDNE